MFGRRGASSGSQTSRPAAPPMQGEPQAAPAAPPPSAAADPARAPERAPAAAQPAVAAKPAPPPPPVAEPRAPQRSEGYYATKSSIFNALVEAIDLSMLTRLSAEDAREEIRDVVNDIIALKNVVMSISEQEDLLEDICKRRSGLRSARAAAGARRHRRHHGQRRQHGLHRDPGRMQQTSVRFRDNKQLMNICQRIVSQVGRRVDESSPICDARLADGSRVNVIAPPLAIDGPTLTFVSSRRTN